MVVFATQLSHPLPSLVNVSLLFTLQTCCFFGGLDLLSLMSFSIFFPLFRRAVSGVSSEFLASKSARKKPLVEPSLGDARTHFDAEKEMEFGFLL